MTSWKRDTAICFGYRCLALASKSSVYDTVCVLMAKLTDRFYLSLLPLIFCDRYKIHYAKSNAILYGLFIMFSECFLVSCCLFSCTLFTALFSWLWNEIQKLRNVIVVSVALKFGTTYRIFFFNF